MALRACVALTLVGGAASAFADTNLPTNGSFELGTSWIGPTSPFSLSAQDGSHFLDLTGYQTGAPFGGVTQTIATTPGKQYDLSFYLGSYTAVWGGPPVSITAAAGGTTGLFTNGSATRSSTATGGGDGGGGTAVPEPAVLGLMCLGLAAVGLGAAAAAAHGCESLTRKARSDIDTSPARTCFVSAPTHM